MTQARSDIAVIEMVERDLRHYADKQIGSLRIDMDEVRAILRLIEIAKPALQSARPVASEGEAMEPIAPAAYVYTHPEGYRNVTLRPDMDATYVGWLKSELYSKAALDAARTQAGQPQGARWTIGDLVQKKRGSAWRGKVVGFYVTEHTPIGYAVESLFETGSVQVWPEAALEVYAAIATLQHKEAGHG